MSLDMKQQSRLTSILMIILTIVMALVSMPSVRAEEETPALHIVSIKANAACNKLIIEYTLDEAAEGFIVPSTGCPGPANFRSMQSPMPKAKST